MAISDMAHDSFKYVYLVYLQFKGLPVVYSKPKQSPKISLGNECFIQPFKSVFFFFCLGFCLFFSSQNYLSNWKAIILFGPAV